MSVKTALFGVTPGPFTEKETLYLAKDVYRNFDLVVNHEPISTKNLSEWGFGSKHIENFSCPAFLYTPELSACIKQNKRMIGFTIGGFNMPIVPYGMWPREDWQYNRFVE